MATSVFYLDSINNILIDKYQIRHTIRIFFPHYISGKIRRTQTSAFIRAYKSSNFIPKSPKNGNFKYQNVGKKTR